ncbi:hypothetical protein AB833_06585 [Chromatiales bacterium (ex Bugula neritina AB1)]|nr:hypothetical protein AB833_06585 [Chromatiales bacterium (ex Bugula neritina AB1)]
MGGEETETICTVSEHLPFALECNISYFRSIMEALAQRLPDFADHTFVFTRSVTELPRKFDYLPSLVVFVMGDEWARVPLYAHRVHAVFKAPGQDMKLALHKGWLRFNLMAYVQQLRQRCKRYPHHHIDRCNNLFAIPYGYYRLPTRDKVTPINRRAIDVSFTGSVDHKKVLGGLVKTNKVLSRERMVRTVDSWKRHKTYTTDVKLSGYFPKANDKPEFESYPRILMDTKICLSPRGTHLETYRLCEGMYYGCIVIAEEQPDHWFAENSPAIIVDDWRELPQWLDRLLEDPQEMQRRQQASIDYWDSTLAPDRIAAYLSNTLQSMRSPDAANDTLAPLKIDHAA